MQASATVNPANNEAVVQNVCFGVLLDFSSESSAFLLLKSKSLRNLSNNARCAVQIFLLVTFFLPQVLFPLINLPQENR